MNCLPAQPVASKCDGCSPGQACSCSAPLAPSTSSCEDAPGDLVAKGILLTYDRIIDFSERAVRSNSAELNLDNDSSAISSCAAMQAMEGGCSLPEAEWLCPKTCGKCAKPTLSCLDCFTRPAFPLCYGEDAQRLPQCAMCRSGGCDSCASCTKPTELMPIIAKEPETDQSFMNGKYAYNACCCLLAGCGRERWFTCVSPVCTRERWHVCVLVVRARDVSNLAPEEDACHG